ncbi:hypothetical protein C5167_039846 [Papaver somniferum]|uniref:Protein kinase domain-containing protein n=1 Tax=Papaver somniferum TaxID=3469 RepID=A0A4Y7ID93_PAPSO|nr:hypothetical protein C5167_039846 [Papaver somniferum]
MPQISIFRFGRSSAGNIDAEDYTSSITKFKFQELAAATKNFAAELLLDEEEYGRTFKGCLNLSGQKSSSQDVAIRQVDEDRIYRIYRGHEQTMFSKIRTCSLLHHPNIVDLIGYSINDKNQMFLVYEFMPLGSLKNHLHDLPRNENPLDWNTRMKIAAGTAKGLKYLHDRSNPPVVHGNIKPSNILIGEGPEEYWSDDESKEEAVLAPQGGDTTETDNAGDFLLLKERIPENDESGYARLFSRQSYRQAPEFLEYFILTQQSDIYSFGLVLLELISGRIAEIKPRLVEWAKRKLVYGKEFTALADPLLNGHYPEQGLYQAFSLAAECLRREDVSRPRIGYVVTVLSNLASETYDPNAIQINRAGTLAIGNNEKEKLRELWQHASFDI